MAKKEQNNGLRCAIMICSDRAFAGARPEKALPLLSDRVKELKFKIESTAIVPDDKEKIKATLKQWIDEKIPLILTSGGTGMAPTDFTPEATLELIDRRAPGMEEAMRFSAMKTTPRAMISRAVVGIADRSLLINLPGNPNGAVENLKVIEPVLVHTVRKVVGKKGV